MRAKLEDFEATKDDYDAVFIGSSDIFRSADISTASFYRAGMLALNETSPIAPVLPVVHVTGVIVRFGTATPLC